MKQEYSEHKYSSTPLEWITMDTNIAYWLHTSSNVTLTQSHTHWHTNRMNIKFGFVSQAQIHLIGNPVSWCLANMGLLAYQLLAVVYLVRRRRGFKDLPDGIQTTHHTSLNLLDQRWLTCLIVRNVN